jgi:hypothetical protein
MMRRLLGRLRASRAGVLYHRLDGTSEEDGRPWMTSFADDGGEGVPREGVPREGSPVVGERREIAAEARVGAVDATVVAAVDEAVDVAAETGVMNDTRSGIDTAPGGAPAIEIDPGLVPALNRVADAFERMAASMEVEHREREARLAAVEELLRELVTGLAQPTAVSPAVVGGSISLDMLRDGLDDGPEIDLSDPQLELEGSDDSPLDAV